MIFNWLSRLFAKPAPVGTITLPPPAPAPSPTPAKPTSGGTTSVSSGSAPATKFYSQTNRHTPNLSPGRQIRPTHIILHHTGGSYAGSVSWCMDPISKVSYHCIIARSGKRTTLALPNQRTWHAGVSSWGGRKNCNDFSIGIAWEGDTYQTPLSEDAILSAIEYLLPILGDFKIPLKNIIRHADISPGRKTDCSPAAHTALLQTLRKVLT
jgi:N-acetyl-anhydromuramyl-L-alanine amidase AmpD